MSGGDRHHSQPHNAECIWFNPEHIVRTIAVGSKTKVELSNGHSIIVDSRLAFFNNRIHNANQLLQIAINRGNHPAPITFYLEPKTTHLLTKEKTGKYNFTYLEENHK
ncbi:competence protein ComK [Neobacillus drentensis]|uniref:competence protein ComK n=1 Tax=Neobacillus drentensis TaxID=220684 RepID=UPI002287675A|nr:competence protein ComK [Neobacillus drentensis]